MAELFDYVVAHPWPGGRLSTYAYGTEVQRGTEENARAFLAYVQRQSPGHDWNIYRVTFTPIGGVDSSRADQRSTDQPKGGA
jgi:hypothetical protein